MLAAGALLRGKLLLGALEHLFRRDQFAHLRGLHVEGIEAILRLAPRSSEKEHAAAVGSDAHGGGPAQPPAASLGQVFEELQIDIRREQRNEKGKHGRARYND